MRRDSRKGLGGEVAHSYVCQLARAVFPSTAKVRLMLMLKGYFDEAGTEGRAAKALVVAGLVSPEVRWERFETDWRLVLASHGLRCFHAQDFFRRKKNFKRGTAWDSETKRQGLLDQLTEVIQSHSQLALAAFVEFTGYRETFPTADKIKQWVGTEYRIAGAACMWQAAKWADLKEYAPSEIVNFFFDAGHANANDFLDAYRQSLRDIALQRQFRLGSLVFDSDKRLCPLQAADLLAYRALQGMRWHPNDWSKVESFIRKFLGPRIDYEQMVFQPKSLADIRKLYEEQFRKRRQRRKGV